MRTRGYSYWLIQSVIWVTICVASVRLIAHPVSDDRAREADRLHTQRELSKPPEEFRLSGVDGRSYSLESFQNSDSVTFVSISDFNEACEAESIGLVNELKKRVSKKQRIVLIHSGLNPDRNKWTRIWKSHKGDLLILWDNLQIVSMRMMLQSPGDHFVVDPKKRKVLSSGKRADLFKGELAQTGATATSCKELPDRGVALNENLELPEFTKSFAQPFMRACVRCHIFSRELDYFGTLEQVRGWQAMSLKTLEVGRMPGGFDPNPHGFNALGYSSEDVRLVTRFFQKPQLAASWIPKFSEEYKKIYARELNSQISAVTKELGQPDLVLKTPEPIVVRASGDLLYRYMMLSQPFEEERVIRAVVLESDMTVIHHAHVIVVPRAISGKESKDLEQGDASAAAAFLKIYGESAYKPVKMSANGRSIRGVRLEQPIAATFSRPFRYAVQNPGEGVRVPKGHSLAVILHIESVGKETTEHPTFKVYFAKPSLPVKSLLQFTVTPLELTIPAGKEVTVRSEVVVAEPIQLEKVLIHMHYRGAAARIFVQNSDSESEELVADLPYHLFKLQNFFNFTNLKLLPGAKLITELTFDNSQRNIANPYPDRSVKIGKASLDDEMHFPRIFYSRINRWPNWSVQEFGQDGKDAAAKSVSDIFYDNPHTPPGAFVVVAHGASCPVMRQNMREFQRLFSSLKQKGARFLIVNSVPQDQTPERRALAMKELKDFGISEPVYFDSSQEIIKSLGLKVVGEIAVIRPSDFEVVFRGGISDRVTYDFARPKAKQEWARDAIMSLLNKKEPVRNSAPIFGCSITFNQTGP